MLVFYFFRLILLFSRNYWATFQSKVRDEIFVCNLESRRYESNFGIFSFHISSSKGTGMQQRPNYKTSEVKEAPGKQR